MGKLDYKSMLVGVLCITCFLLLIGQRSDGSFGNIVVESITIKGDNDEGSFVSIENRDGEEILYLGEAVSTGGILQIFNKDGSQVLYGGTAEGGVGIITTYDATEKMTTYIGASGDNDGGLLSVMDENENVAVQILIHTFTMWPFVSWMYR